MCILFYGFAKMALFLQYLYKLLLFFQNKAKIVDSFDNEFIVISLFVYDNSLYCFIVPKYYFLIDAKIGIRPHHCRLTQTTSLVSVRTRQRLLLHNKLL